MQNQYMKYCDYDPFCLGFYMVKFMTQGATSKKA